VIDGTLILIAKEPRAGYSKTRLVPPCTPAQAAALAEAALIDTLEAIAATPAARHLVALDGEAGDWLPSGFEVTTQRGEGLAQRLAAAFEDAGGPAFVVAMDTPQVTPELLGAGLERLSNPGVDATLGLAHDGGYWGIGLSRPDGAVFEEVPMSQGQTGALQVQRLRDLGLRTEFLPRLTDVDRIEDAQAVARAAPDGRFAAALRASGHASDHRQAVAEASP